MRRRSDRELFLLLAAGLCVVLGLSGTLWMVMQQPGAHPAGAPPRLLPGPASAAPVLPAPGAAPAGAASQPDRSPERIAETRQPVGPDGVLGVVSDALTGEPVGVFQVDVLPADPLADDGALAARLETSISTPFRLKHGTFFLAQEPGTWDVVVRAPGYLPSVRRGVVTPAMDKAPIPFVLDSGPGIVGLVYDPGGMPAAGVQAFLEVKRLFAPAAEPPRLRTARTGADGRFSFSPLPPGEYAVSLRETDNMQDRIGSIFVEQGTTRVECTLVARHQLTLSLQDEHGLPLQNVLVEARSSDHFARGRSNENGLLVLEHLPDGAFHLVATAEGHTRTELDLSLVGGSSSEARWMTLPTRRDPSGEDH